ncbi:MAG: hypothetical protein K6G50_04545 [bacterium]|nr:hypothetical protein [bacterium]
MSVELSSGLDIWPILSSFKMNWTESNGILYYYILNSLMKNTVGQIVDNTCGLVSFSHNQIILAKLFSVFLSVLSCFLVYKICKKVGNRTIGIYAAFLLAIHCGNLCVSDYIRFYSLNTFFCCLSTFILLYLDFDKDISRYIKALYIMSLLACTSSMMCSSLLFLGHAVYCIIKFKCSKRVLTFFSIAALLHGLFFSALWLNDLNALDRKAGYVALFVHNQWLYLLFYCMGFGIIDVESPNSKFFGHLSDLFWIKFFLCLSVVFFILVVMRIIRYCGYDFSLFCKFLKLRVNKNNLYQKTNDILLLSLSLLIFPLAMMLLIYPFSNIINYGNTSYLHPVFAIFLAYFMYSANRYIRWVFLTIVLLSLPFSLFRLSSPVILLTLKHENSCYIMKNFGSDLIVMSSDGYLTFYKEKIKKTFIIQCFSENGEIDRGAEEYICNLVSDSPVQFWLPYSKFDKKYSHKMLLSFLYNIMRRTGKKQNVVYLRINSDFY